MVATVSPQVETPPETGKVDYDTMMPVWIARITAGDQQAARLLVEHLQPLVLRIVRARRPRRLAEEDLTQEVFMKMFSRLGQYAGDAPFTHWVSRIAVTTCMDHWRALQRRPELRWADLAEWETDVLERVTDEQNAKLPGDLLARNCWAG
jgi:DNA-directed RNA polymerase specialized sigma24 family protein